MLLSIFPIAGNLTPWFDIGLSVILTALIIYGCFKAKLSMKVIVAAITFIACFVLSSVFDLKILNGVSIVLVVFYCIYMSLLLTSAEKETELRHNKKVSKKENSLTINETDALIEKISTAIYSLSVTQTGALITIERSDDLTTFMQKTGTKINAPVTSELIETIFYKGTPLHDGATIIRGNMILSSAVFYQPTQRPLNGKYGSRHRAAIGISEICDALTIVVSEETGKVSFAFKGELITVPVAQFKDKLKEYYYNAH